MNAKKYGVLLAVLAVGVLNLSSCRGDKKIEADAVTPPAVTAPAGVKTKPLVSVPEKKLLQDVSTPKKTESFVPKKPGIRISRVSVPDKLVALTFDDGPHGVLTPRILDVLDRYGAKCTFFVLGKNVSLYPHIVRRAASAGHEIANHSWSHPKLTSLSRERVFSELSRTNEAISRATGKVPALMRPPYGAMNASLLQAIYSSFGIPAVMWDVDTNDWRKPGVQTVINRAVNGAKPGSIVLVHDIHASTADAVEGIVRGLQARGFRLVTVSELIAAGRRAAGSSSNGVAPSQPTPSVMRPAFVPIENGAKPNPLLAPEEKSTLPSFITVPTLESPMPKAEDNPENEQKLSTKVPVRLSDDQAIPMP